ncbi:MAG TPA: hypothetical protein GX529_09810 [Firmicutes bacterium]|nr:hypothetical protein [Candidatus Fermentithermobacillaceae bacterium]
MKALQVPFLKSDYLKLVLVGMLGVVLIVIGSFMSGSGKATIPDDHRILAELREYQNILAKQLEEVVSAVQGAGKVHVSIALERGPETVYVTNTTLSRNSQSESTSQGQTRQTITESETSQVVTGRISGSGDSLIPEKVIAPKISGCVVVAEGASDPRVKTNIYRAVQVLLDIPIYKIEVLPMQGGK